MSSKKNDPDDLFRSPRSRIQHILDITGLKTRPAFERKTGVSKNSLKKIMERDTVGPDLAAQIAAATGIDPNWVLLGRGKPPTWASVRFPAGDEDDVFVSVERGKARCDAGGGCIPEEGGSGQRFKFRAEWVRRVSGNGPSHLVLMDVTGDSMLPTICPGDMVLVDRAQTAIDDGAMYVIRDADDTLKVKQLSHSRGAVTVMSHNPDKESYPTYTVPLSEMAVIGRVLWLGRQLTPTKG